MSGTAQAAAGRVGRPRVAYLSTLYPAVSHAFILREVLALRERGFEIETFAIRRSGPEHVLSRADEAAAAATRTLLPISPPRLLARHLAARRRDPHSYVQTLWFALRLGRGARGKLWQSFYFSEGVLLAAECERAGAEHLHAHFGSPSADVAMLAARLAGLPWSFTIHGTDVNAGDRRLLAEKVRDAAFVVCAGHFGRGQLLALVDEREWAKIHVVRCGLDLERFVRSTNRSAPDVGGTLRILAVGRLEGIKGHGVLLEAFAELRRRGLDARLTVVGNGPRRRRLEALADELGLRGSVEFAGAVGQDEIIGFYERADALCLPSFSEGVPVVLMEAMALGVPVVASRIAGVPELVEDGVSGLLVNPGAPSEVADALERLAKEPELRLRLAEAGRRRVVGEFDIRRSALRLEKLFAAENGVR